MCDFKRLFRGRVSVEDTERKLLAQFYVTLKATFSALKQERDTSSDDGMSIVN